MWDLFLYILFWMGSPLAGMFVLGIFTRRANGLGACIGAVAGAGGIFVVMKLTDWNGMLYPVVGLGGCVVTGYLVSLLVTALSNSKPCDLSGLTIHTVDKQD